MKNYSFGLRFTSFAAGRWLVCKRILQSYVKVHLIRRYILSLATLGASFSDELYSLLLDSRLSLHFISAPNLFTGGPLTILKDCLDSIPHEMSHDDSRVILICSSEVYRNISLPPTVHPLCLPLSRSSWIIRLYYERIGFYILSTLCNVHTWLSLHDFTSNVRAKCRVTYYHNAAPFWIPQLRQAIFSPGMLLWKFFYFPLAAWGLDRNYALIVQQNWLKHEFNRRFPRLRVLVMPPISSKKINDSLPGSKSHGSSADEVVSAAYGQPSRGFVFFYPCIPRVFKNIELAIESVLDANAAGFDCSLLLTFSGDENLYSRYLRWCYRKYTSIKFIGYQDRAQMDALYKSVDALLFTSLLETWGLPLSEAQLYGLPIASIDLPYVRETARGYPLLFLASDKKVINLSMFFDALKKDSFAKSLALPLPNSILVSEECSQIDWGCLWEELATPRSLSLL